MRLRRRNPELTRSRLANPFSEPFVDRVRRAGAIHLWGNARVEELPAGYQRIVPLDRDKRVGQAPQAGAR